MDQVPSDSFGNWVPDLMIMDNLDLDILKDF